jgi:putative Mg2+ transporter-C (MgtC) family protein
MFNLASPGAPVTEVDIVVRLAMSFAAGALVGMERAAWHQVAGMRTHILIAMGSTLLMLLSIWIPQEFFSLKNGDPGRIAAQVVSGIGFLGGGAILRLGNNVRGITTAASLWLIAAVGLSIGAGMFFAAAVVVVFSLLALRIIDLFERRFFPQERIKTLELTFRNTAPNTPEILDILKRGKIRVLSVDTVITTGANGSAQRSTLNILAGIPITSDIAGITREIEETHLVTRIKFKEKF